MPPLGRRPGGPMGSRIKSEKPKNSKKALARLLKYIGKSKMLVILLTLIMAAATIAELAGPALQGAAIDTIKVEGGKVSVDLSAMLSYLAFMGILFAISASLHLFQG